VEVISEVVSTMSAINTSSCRISEITSLIDGIAFQTNILALNAAVEAARAGDRGRGFAVVAGEVRTLAGRASNAAKEIKTLINESVERVEAGSRLVGDAGQVMQEILSSVHKVTGIVGEISAAANEQSDGICCISTAITQLDRATQQNAALVEQSAAASSSLKEQAANLTDVVGAFHVGTT
jgi:methyl-accepting chemotaxis protein